ncbi:hypothetical protein [uncultured Amphritea sp.]|uniref:hypothetical protein n=1 Tax=uncultured Amphritea sp. TaxID=981605 RepID=UPI00260F5A41|nr:hypothetical protein [uncultured Amphritea sp.]
MLTYTECLEMSNLSQNEVDAIAEHEHTDSIIAMALGHYLCCHHDQNKVRKIIMDDITRAQRKGDTTHEKVLRQVLNHFVETHPSQAAQLAKAS